MVTDHWWLARSRIEFKRNFLLANDRFRKQSLEEKRLKMKSFSISVNTPGWITSGARSFRQGARSVRDLVRDHSNTASNPSWLMTVAGFESLSAP
jgi:hypothetical protein